MTLEKIIERADRNTPNGFSPETKMDWLAELDGRIALEVLLMDTSEVSQFQYSYPQDLQREPLVAFPHDGLYSYWLESRILLQAGEYEKYQNAMAGYNQCYELYVNWICNTYAPAQGTSDNVVGSLKETPSYYITAYGLAVRQGFVGTLDEWLVSITAYGMAMAAGFEGTEAQWLESLKGEKGEQGEKGDAGARLEIGTVETLPAGSNATASIAGTPERPVLNIGIPRGMNGTNGADGIDSILCYQGAATSASVNSFQTKQGVYRVSANDPIHGVTDGFIIHAQVLPDELAAQLLVSRSGSLIWLRTGSENGWNIFHQLNFGYGTVEEMPAEPEDGQLFFVKE